MSGVITLTTDFGLRDAYVGAMKGVLLRRAPEATLVDLGHQIPPQDVLAGAFHLRHAALEYPAGTVHLAVVDPGVGGARRPIVIDGAGYLWVGPDNGLFSFALAADPAARVFELTRPDLRREPVSATFHGRDVFAPAAAAFATGLEASAAGPAVTDPVTLPATRPRRDACGLQAEIVHVDTFGNLISCASREDLDGLGMHGGLRVQAAGTLVEGLVATYGDVEPGQLAALFGSGGLLEIGCRDGSAAARLGLDRGDRLHVGPASA